MSTSGPTEAERRIAMEQALASTRISGHVATPEFLADCEALIKGTMTGEQARAASAARAAALDRELTERNLPVHGTTLGRVADIASAAARHAAQTHVQAGRLPAGADPSPPEEH